MKGHAETRRANIGRSFAPSPIAIDCASAMPSLRHSVRKQPRLAFGIDDVADHGAGYDAVARLECVRVHVVDAEFALQPIADMHESARDDRGAVSEVLERENQPARTVGERHGGRNVVKRSGRQALSASATRRRKLSLKSISPRIARSVIAATSSAHAVHSCEFVDHFHLDQRRVHIERDEAPIAAINGVFLNAEVERETAGRFEQFGFQPPRIGEFAAQRNFDARTRVRAARSTAGVPTGV